MKVLLFLALLAIVCGSMVEAVEFQPHENKHHVYRSCGDNLARRVTYLCNGGYIRREVLTTLECCSIGCSDRQLFSWCDL